MERAELFRLAEEEREGESVRKTKAKDNPLQRVRCAIYTRKSTDEGLDQDFNSLDAQREAAESFIASQRHEGWVALPEQYDDGGFSGGTIERPGLVKLLRDVEAGRIDCVVVYKVDRLSRSLLDFTRIIEIFDRHNVSFVSVTQHFNTTSSMGRLTLNILLSFAQFEREIIGERIRDKIAAAKRKGKHTGGLPILGYDIDRANRRLVVNPEEADLVQRIFKRFLRLGSPLQLAKELNAQGYKTKTWVKADGQVREGRPWNKAHISRALNNRKYIGEVVHKDAVYPGEHEAIIPRKLWDDVHSIMAENHHARSARTRAKTPALLKGIIRCGHCGKAMGITFTRNREKQYRYYLCVHASKNGYDSCPVKSVAAGEIEQAVLGQLRAVFRAPELIAKTFRAAKTMESAETERLRRAKGELEDHLRVLKEMAVCPTRSDGKDVEKVRKINEDIDEGRLRLQEVTEELAVLQENRGTERDVIDALGKLDGVWDELFPAERARVVQLLVEQVVVYAGGIDVRIRANGLRSLISELKGTVSKAETRSTKD